VERLAEAIYLAVSNEEMGSRAAALGQHLQRENGVANAVEVFQMLTEGKSGTKTASF
jgi:hypothetical protein